ncbi:MAG TPA: ribonuclease III [Terriglobales bacterium]|nr:ribonuclease III [Terriglobales bacterium]
MKSRELRGLEEALGHRFHRSEVLQEAITHSSYAREQEAQTSVALRDNEQLEFLGDAVLGFVTSQELFTRYPQFREGQLSKTRAYLVSESHLVRAAQELQLGEYLRLGHGEEKSGGRHKPALLVDALEAVLAALYLDGGLDTARNFILRHILEPELARLEQSGSDTFPVTDYKSALQEAAHLLGRKQPSYVLVKEHGPEHKKTFTVEARIHTDGDTKAEYVARGEGMTKKQAEQSAAKEALQYLRSQGASKE